VQGFHTLTTPEDLLCKLQREYDRLKQNHGDVDAAFNFFVTAEHLPDWLWKNGKRLPKSPKNFRNDCSLTRICTTLANGAKHFTPDTHAVSHTEPRGYVLPGYVLPGYFQESILIHLNAREAKEFRKPSVDALELATMVLDFWKKFFNDSPACR
jgi:hypothetical protein